MREKIWFPIILPTIGLAMVGFAISASRLGLAGSPGVRIGQIFVVLLGIACAVSGLVISSQGARKFSLGLLRSQTALIAASMIAGLLLCEIVSLVIEVIEQPAASSRGAQMRNEIKTLIEPVPDSKLELRLPPHAGGHDAKGFRNDSVPKKVDVVALGDSQTWGVNASRSEAWPQVLGQLSGRTVYNMGLGSYGTVHYWVLTDEALELSPQLIVIGLFLGNDLWDAYRMVYSLGIYPQFRDPNASNELLIDTVVPRYHETVRESEAFKKRFQTHTRPSTWYDFLRAHSAFARVFYQRGLWPTAGRRDYEDYQLNKAWALEYPEKGAVYEHGSVRTVFMTGQHLLGLDLDDPRIAEGLRITKEMLLRIKAKAAARNTQLIVLLIPTKELVYADAVTRSAGVLNTTFARVVSMESRVRDEIISLCRENNLEYVDPLPSLRSAIDRGEQIYPWTGDSHYTARGYRLLASDVNKAITATRD